MKPNFFSKSLIPALYILKTIRKNRTLASVRIGIGLLFSKRKYSIVNVGIANYRESMFLNEKKLDRCATAFYTSVGPVKGCFYYLTNSNFPGSHEYEQLHGSC